MPERRCAEAVAGVTAKASTTAATASIRARAGRRVSPRRAGPAVHTPRVNAYPPGLERDDTWDLARDTATSDTSELPQRLLDILGENGQTNSARL